MPFRRHRSSTVRRRSGGRLLGLLAVAGLLAIAAAPAEASDGRTASHGGRVLQVSQAGGLAAGGQQITVHGSGFDEAKGIYVSLCVVPTPGQAPGPCGGGVDREGTSGASAWISSNPPSYAQGLPTAYGPGGSFQVTVEVRPQLDASTDCYQVRCAIVTRNDHTRGSDRSQDLFVPVTFAAPGGGTAPGPGPVPEPPAPDTIAPAPTTPPETTTTTVDPATVAPATELYEDGRIVSDGIRSLTTSATADLDPAGAEIAVEGAGFDAAAGGVYVALCRVPEPGRAPGPCTAGADAAAWITSSPPDHSAHLAQPFEGDAFSVTLTVPAVIDADTDCREVACAITTRHDDAASEDRRADLLVPVSFLATSPTTTTEAPQAEVTATPDHDEAAAPDDADTGSGSGSAAPLLLGAAALVVAGGGLATTLVRRRRTRGPA